MLLGSGPPSVVFSLLSKSTRHIQVEVTIDGRFDLTCWLMRTIATSFRWVNSWNAVSIADTCVSGLIREHEMM
jgi:hypothetical protein